MRESIIRESHVLGESWVFFVILLCMGLLAYVHNMYPARFQKLFKATFNERMTRQVMREEMVFSHRASWLLLIVSGLSLALIATMLVMRGGDVQQTGPATFGLIFGLLAAFLILRQSVRSMIGLAMDRDVGLREFSFVSALIYKTEGFLFLPLATLLAFFHRSGVEVLTGLVLSTLIIASLYRFYRAIMIAKHYRAPIFYMIVYLCALELIPTLVIIRLIFSHV